MKKNIFLSITLILLITSAAYTQLSITINTATNATCNGINDGSITTTTNNGTGPYNYIWSPSGGTSSDATNLAPGNYTVTVTDATMATATATAVVGENFPVIITTDGMSNYFGYNVSCFAGNNGWINTTSAGGLLVGVDSVEFNYTGSQQIYVVPAGVTQVTIKAWGAQGGANWVNNNNFGGYAVGNLSVTPGETLYVYVGQQPTSGITGGYNGGGNGDGAGKGGGGASDVRQGGITLNDRKIVGAGGGGAGYWSSLHVVGGIGGGATGGNGYREPDYASNPGGVGATQTAGGAYGTCVSFNVTTMAGSFGQGGTPLGYSCGCEGYGGGGGWYGGAGSGNCRGGGGGSSYVGTLISANMVGGVKAGNGKVTIIFSAAEPVYSLWSNGATTDDVTNLIAGNYTLTATSMSGCVATETFVLTEPSTVNGNLSATNTSCIGTSDGMIVANPSGGIPGYTYFWPFNSATTSTNSGLPAGNYSVNITDTAGCLYTESISVSEPAPFNISFNSTNALCFGGNDGSVTAVITGGTPGYTYLWSPNSETTSGISGLTQGVYVLAITDTNGCTYMDSVTISQPSDINLSATTVGETMGNDGSINLTVSGGTPGYTFNWSNSATTEDITGLAGGSYTVIVTDMNGCDDTLTVLVSSTFGIVQNESVELMMYPNPTDGIFYIQPEASTSGEYSVSIRNIHGQVVQSLSGTIKTTPILIDATKLSAGSYLVLFNTNSGTFTKKLVIR